MSTNGKKLRFAALRRVSTEQQEKMGESLRTQKLEIERAVAQVGGCVTEWYGGQEHATPGWEKKELTRLMTDAVRQPRMFDAVIVSNTDRWSRDNDASRRGLDTLKKHGIRFFTGSTEHDLFKSEVRLFLGMSAEIGQYQAAELKVRSMNNRINRAKRGFPTCGKLPFGRTFDKKTEKWDIDKDKQRLIEGVADRYLAGENMLDIARGLGIDPSLLHKTLTKRCGDKWIQTFDSDEFNIHEVVETRIPELLPLSKRRQIDAKTKANKTYQHGQTKKNKYLLGRMVFCEACGYALTGYTNHQKTGYYKHQIVPVKACACKQRKHWATRAAPLEDAVIRHLFEMFGNPVAVERAIDKAMPDLDAQRQHQSRMVELEALIRKEKEGRKKVGRLVQQGFMEEDEAEETLKSSAATIERYHAECEQLAARVSNIPSANDVKVVAKQLARAFRLPKASVRASAASSNFSNMTWEEKHELLKRVFAGTTADGRRAGVYVEWIDGKTVTCRYTIRGLIERSGVLPMAAGIADTLVNPEYASAEFQKDGVTKCALYRVRPALPAPRFCRRDAATRRCTWD